MKEIKIKSVIPIYLVGVTWLLYSFIFPLYEFRHLLFAAVTSAAVYIISSLLIPQKTLVVKEEIHKTGVAHIDTVIATGAKYIFELESLSGEINNSKISGDISKIASISERIFGLVSKNPNLSGQLKTFMDYYYPTIIKLLDSYNDLITQPSAGNNISGAINKIEEIMDTIVHAFNKQLDNMYSDKAMDISTDIDVMKNILASEGLDLKDAGKM